MKTVPVLAAAALAIAGIGVPVAPAVAQSTLRAVTVFGRDQCPRDVICVRAPENDRYRIPKELRGLEGQAAAERWGDRARSIEYVGASGTMSCSPAGAGGASGCFRELNRKARAEREASGEKPAVEF